MIATVGDGKPVRLDSINLTQTEIDSIAHVKFINDQFSPLSGEHIKSVLAIKKLKNDPASFEFISAICCESEEDGLILYTRFRGKNGFGRVVTRAFVTRVDSIGAIESIKEVKQ